MVILLGCRRRPGHALLEDRILASITRAYLLEEDAEERPCTLDDVAAAEEAFIASTVREAMPIAVVDDSSCLRRPGR